MSNPNEGIALLARKGDAGEVKTLAAAAEAADRQAVRVALVVLGALRGRIGARPSSSAGADAPLGRS